MAKEGQSSMAALDSITSAAQTAVNKGPPPVHLWNPPYCGEIDMRIATDGTWFYQKTPIGRPALVKLFASVLKREDDRYFLVTPVEKCGIAVDDAPFLAVEMRVERAGASSSGTPPPETGRSASEGSPGGGQDAARDRSPDRFQRSNPPLSREGDEKNATTLSGQILHFRTNVDDWVTCGGDHPLRFDPEVGTGGLKPYLHVRRGLWAKVTRALFYDLVELGEERMVDGRRMFGVASQDAFFPMAPADSLRDYCE
jgi:hypothetical protein